jgi:hypothetical protein
VTREKNENTAKSKKSRKQERKVEEGKRKRNIK